MNTMKRHIPRSSGLRLHPKASGRVSVACTIGRAAKPYPYCARLLRLRMHAARRSERHSSAAKRKKTNVSHAGMRALAETGTFIHYSLDYKETLRQIAEVLMRTFATSCIIDLIDEDGTFQRVAASQPPQMSYSPTHPVYDAIKSNTSTCISDSDDFFKTQPNHPMRAMLASVHARSCITVPVCDPQGRVVGALTCLIGKDDPRPAYTPDDVLFAEEIGRRAGYALEHARAYERERRISTKFQKAALPSILPVAHGISLFADYRPSYHEVTIGGDWYDAFTLADGRIAITIGDVLGKGIEAAVTMAKVRQALRSAASLQPDPRAMLTGRGTRDRRCR